MPANSSSHALQIKPGSIKYYVESSYDAPIAAIRLPSVVQVDSLLLCAQSWLAASEWFEHEEQLSRLNAFSM